MVQVHLGPLEPNQLVRSNKLNTSWGISSAGRAPALQAGGHRFDPDILHYNLRVVSLDL